MPDNAASLLSSPGEKAELRARLGSGLQMTSPDHGYFAV